MKKRTLGLVFSGLLLGAMVGSACEDDTPATDDIGRACTDHCQRWTECEDDLDFEVCLARCFNALNRCELELLRDSIAELDACTAGSCDAVLQCSDAPRSECLVFDVM